jgi:bacillithiol system protein YtxJ
MGRTGGGALMLKVRCFKEYSKRNFSASQKIQLKRYLCGMNFWNQLESISRWEELLELSRQQPVLVFKHSTRCSISVMALDRINRKWEPGTENSFSPWYLDLLNHREISNRIAADTGVEHQSPQLLLIKDGKCIKAESHQAIRLEDFTA